MPRGAKMEVVPRSPRRDRGQFRSVLQANLTPAALSLALALGWLLLSSGGIQRPHITLGRRWLRWRGR